MSDPMKEDFEQDNRQESNHETIHHDHGGTIEAIRHDNGGTIEADYVGQILLKEEGKISI
jgi:hypothetical protein